jgi:hypothetical protein
MPEDRKLVGTPAYLPFMWPRQLLRPIATSTPPSIFMRAHTRSSRVTTHQRVGAGAMSTRHSSSLTIPRSSSVRYRGSHHEGGTRSIANSPEAADVSPKTPVPSNCACAVPEKVKRCKLFEFGWRTVTTNRTLRHLLNFASLNFFLPRNGLSFV